MPPVLALVVVVVAQSWPAAAPATNTTVIEVVDPLTDLRPAGDVIAVAGVDTSDTDRRIEFWQTRVRADARDDISWANLGDLFDLKGRQTGDIANYVSAQNAYKTALDIAPRSSAALIGAARISSTLHDFAGALVAATALLELDPSATGALGIVFDASLELGNVDNARHALALLDDRVDSPAVLGRQARLAFMTGDTAAALDLSAQALNFALDSGDAASSIAFYNYAHAEYALFAGDFDAAASSYDAALVALPGYPPAMYGEGRVDFARGDLEGAIAHLESATAGLPRPDMLGYLGDLYALAGRTADADRQYATVDFIHGLAAAGGTRVYDREYINFLADHGRNPAAAATLATTELRVRRDVYGYDALAWAFHAASRDDQALEPAHLALAENTQDARLLIHAGLIELANGLTADGRGHIAQGLALNPTFSPLVIEQARAALTQ